MRLQAEHQAQQAADHTEFPDRRRTMLVAGATVVTVMMAYALLTGLFKVKVVDDLVGEVVKVVRGQSDRDSDEFNSRSEKGRK